MSDRYVVYHKGSGEFVGEIDFNPVGGTKRKRYEWAMIFCNELVLDKKIPHPAVRVFVFLALEMDAGGIYYGSQKSVALAMSMDEANISRYIKQLIDGGYVRRVSEGADEWLQVLPAYAHKGKLVMRNRLNSEILQESLQDA